MLDEYAQFKTILLEIGKLHKTWKIFLDHFERNLKPFNDKQEICDGIPDRRTTFQ